MRALTRFFCNDVPPTKRRISEKNTHFSTSVRRSTRGVDERQLFVILRNITSRYPAGLNSLFSTRRNHSIRYKLGVLGGLKKHSRVLLGTRFEAAHRHDDTRDSRRAPVLSAYLFRTTHTSSRFPPLCRRVNCMDARADAGAPPMNAPNGHMP